MISVQEASNILKKELPTIKVIKECKDYGKDYLFVAFETNTPDKEIDPFYLISKNGGPVRKYNIAENVGKFYSAKTLDL